jgi:hypothetical protein
MAYAGLRISSKRPKEFLCHREALAPFRELNLAAFAIRLHSCYAISTTSERNAGKVPSRFGRSIVPIEQVKITSLK